MIDLPKGLARIHLLEDLRTRIRSNMEAERKHSVEHEAKDKLVEELVKANVVLSRIPDRAADRYSLERGLRALASQRNARRDMRRWTCRACAPDSAKGRSAS